MRYIDGLKEKHPKTFRYLQGGIVTVARYHLAGLFILSGIAKAINPFGFSLKLGEYLGALGLEGLRNGILPEIGGVALPAFELFIGFMFLTGISRRVTAWLGLLFLGFFTLLTLWLAIADPISDCGCFGDLIILSNWGTFTKNLLFMLFALIFFSARKSQQKLNPGRLRTIVTYLIFIPLCLMPGLYAYGHLPIIDPTPFKVGVNIPQAMQTAESEVETILVYRNKADGKLHDFSIEDTTWYDSSRWEYVDTRTLGHSSGPDIKNVPMFDETGTDHSAEILNWKGCVLIYVVNRYNPRYEAYMEQLAAYVQRYQGRIVALSTLPLPNTARLESAGIEVLNSDLTVQRTMMQQKYGGALLLHDGTIVGKWPVTDLPQEWEAAADPIAQVLTDNRIAQEKRLTLLFFASIAIVILAYHFRPSLPKK